MQYDDWPVGRLIEREISRPLLLTRYRRRVARSDEVTVQWTRDAWWYSARPMNREANLGPTPNAWIGSMVRGWADALRGARECLDRRKQHRCPRRVPVTVLPSMTTSLGTTAQRHPYQSRRLGLAGASATIGRTGLGKERDV